MLCICRIIFNNCHTNKNKYTVIPRSSISLLVSKSIGSKIEIEREINIFLTTTNVELF